MKSYWDRLYRPRAQEVVSIFTYYVAICMYREWHYRAWSSTWI